MPVPAYYGDVNIKIKVDPDNMWYVAHTAIPSYGTQIAGSIEAINTAWENLRVGWVGTTADEAEAFNTEWQNGIRGLFGTEADPDSGILSKIAVAAGMAAGNYAQTEVTVTKMFTDFTADVNRPHNPNDPPPDPHRDYDTGPISENN